MKLKNLFIVAIIVALSLSLIGCSDEDVYTYNSIEEIFYNEGYLSTDDLKLATNDCLETVYNYENGDMDAAKEFLTCIASEHWASAENFSKHDITKRQTILECIQRYGECGEYNDNLSEIAHKYYGVYEILKQEDDIYNSEIIQTFKDTITTGNFLWNMFPTGKFQNNDILFQIAEDLSCFKDYESFEFYDINNPECTRYVIYLPMGTKLKFDTYMFSDLVYLETTEGKLKNGFNIDIKFYLKPTPEDKEAFERLASYQYPLEEINAISELASDALQE